ncbi:uncharacterized protein C8Q71DRAFT_908722 [Rhodofomes roseus]|uniref:PilJ/NarX-like methyl-accepting chemotaxis transducer n=1 Tax=Rhodofomes roseus TaxID=34475 RepID=A0ABQ8KCQ3_9APHY|nr:uncharacterized protein C8Q71DRAFT_908722 [Rhodofomes roseus]KAH9834880.1 hypothetical protein C8Q71DRAFT_908722 [Rhodofomes roseus]
MRVAFASASFAFLSIGLSTVSIGPESVPGLTTANFARNIYREAEGIAYQTQDALTINKQTLFLPPTHGFGHREEPEQFRDCATSLGQRAQDYAAFLFRQAEQSVDSTAAVQLRDIQNTMQDIVQEAEDLRGLFLPVHTESFDDIRRGIEEVLADLLEKLKDEFPPPDHAPNHIERKGNASLVLGRVEEAIIGVVVQHGMEEEELRARLGARRSRYRDLAEQHPYLTETLLVAGIMLIVPESWILRPLFNFFGMSPKGPVKGESQRLRHILTVV